MSIKMSWPAMDKRCPTQPLNTLLVTGIGYAENIVTKGQFNEAD
jgi:hypothetical protein